MKVKLCKLNEIDQKGILIKDDAFVEIPEKLPLHINFDFEKAPIGEVFNIRAEDGFLVGEIKLTVAPSFQVTEQHFEKDNQIVDVAKLVDCSIVPFHSDKELNNNLGGDLK